MPAIWASSERPLFVRTVWVDGMRHAILSPDDPVNSRLRRRRPRTSTESSYSAKHQPIESRVDRLDGCLVNLHVVVEKSLPDDKIPARIARRQSAPSRARICTERGGSLLEIYVKDIDQSLDESLDGTQQHRGILENEETMYPTNGTDREQSSHSQRDPFSASERSKRDERSLCDAHCNPLSERVLQWLDLSGRARDYEPEEQESKESSTEENRRRWRSVVRRQRHFSQTRESSALAMRERIVVQNYKLRKNYKLDCVEARPARKRSSRKDTTEEQVRRESEIAGSKDQIAEGQEKNLKTEDESQKDLVAVWSSLGRLQLHIVMPSFNSAEKRSSSLESVACD